jgi:hypothetical protein
MSPTKRASAVPGLRAAITGAPPVPAAVDPGAEPAAMPAAPGAAPAPGPVGQRPRPPKPVRYTLDLAPDDHQFLKRFAVDAGVNASVIVRGLLGQLRADPELAGRIRSEAWSQ